jgi:hypothetical protein
MKHNINDYKSNALDYYLKEDKSRKNFVKI